MNYLIKVQFNQLTNSFSWNKEELVIINKINSSSTVDQIIEALEAILNITKNDVKKVYINNLIKSIHGELNVKKTKLGYREKKDMDNLITSFEWTDDERHELMKIQENSSVECIIGIFYSIFVNTDNEEKKDKIDVFIKHLSLQCYHRYSRYSLLYNVSEEAFFNAIVS